MPRPKAQTKRKPQALVLGLSVNGLSVVRSLGRRGIEVTAVDRTRPVSVAASRYIKTFHCFDSPDHEKEILDFLLRFGRAQTERTFLFPTNDFFVLFLSRNRDVLRPLFLFTLAPAQVLETVVNKELLYAEAERLGIPYPRTHKVSTVKGARAVLDDVRFPCFIKPVYSHIWRKRYRNVKVIQADNDKALLDVMADIEPLRMDVLIQEIIPGGDDCIFGVVAYLDEAGEPITVHTKRKLRQYPVFTGNGSYQVTVEDEELERIGARFLKDLGYVGPACAVEFKWDCRDRSYKLIEINARTEVGQELMTQAGIDIPYIAYQYTVHKRRLAPERYRAGLKWICFEWDFFSFMERRKQNGLRFSEWFASLFGVRVFAYFAWDDLRPFVIQQGLFFRRVVWGMLKRTRAMSTEFIFRAGVEDSKEKAAA